MYFSLSAATKYLSILSSWLKPVSPQRSIPYKLLLDAFPMRPRHYYSMQRKNIILSWVLFVPGHKTDRLHHAFCSLTPVYCTKGQSIIQDPCNATGRALSWRKTQEMSLSYAGFSLVFLHSRPWRRTAVFSHPRAQTASSRSHRTCWCRRWRCSWSGGYSCRAQGSRSPGESHPQPGPERDPLYIVHRTRSCEVSTRASPVWSGRWFTSGRCNQVSAEVDVVVITLMYWCRYIYGLYSHPFLHF